MAGILMFQDSIYTSLCGLWRDKTKNFWAIFESPKWPLDCLTVLYLLFFWFQLNSDCYCMLLYQSLQLRKISLRVEGLFNNAGWVLCFKLSLVYFVSTVKKHHLHCSVISMVLKTRPGQNRFCLWFLVLTGF